MDDDRCVSAATAVRLNGRTRHSSTATTTLGKQSKRTNTISTVNLMSMFSGGIRLNAKNAQYCIYTRAIYSGRCEKRALFFFFIYLSFCCMHFVHLSIWAIMPERKSCCVCLCVCVRVFVLSASNLSHIQYILRRMSIYFLSNAAERHVCVCFFVLFFFHIIFSYAPWLKR